jgi:hypothetical protein
MGIFYSPKDDIPMRADPVRKAKNLEAVQLIYSTLGGALLAAAIAIPLNVIMQTEGQNVLLSLTQHNLGWAIYFIVTFVAGALVISFVFSLKNPEKKIIPPFFVLITATSILIVNVILNSDEALFAVLTVYLTAFTALSFGTGFDQVIVKLLGLAVNKDHMKHSQLKAYADIQKIATILTTQARYNLKIAKKPIEEKEDTVILRSISEARFTTYIQLRRIDATHTLINSVFFEAGDYSTIDSGELEEYKREKSVYLQKVLLDQPNEIFVEPMHGYPEELIDRANEDLMGIYEKTKDLTGFEKGRIGFYIIAPVATALYIASTNDTQNTTAYGIIVASIIAALADISRIVYNRTRFHAVTDFRL